MRAKGLTKETIYQLGIKDRGFDSFDVGDTIIVGIHIKEGEKHCQNYWKGIFARKQLKGNLLFGSLLNI